MMKRFLHAFLIWLCCTSLAAAQSGLGQIPSGNVVGNSTASAAAPAAATVTSLFDRAYCSTIGYLLVRFTGSWTCAQGIPANIVWFGAVGDWNGLYGGSATGTDNTPYIQAALNAAKHVFVPPATYGYLVNASNVTLTFGNLAYAILEGSGPEASRLVRRGNTDYHPLCRNSRPHYSEPGI